MSDSASAEAVRLVDSLWTHGAMDQERTALLSYIARVERERDAARAALRKYGLHMSGCMGGDPYECTCGLEAALGDKP